jgi:hypothetical protein
VPFFDPTKSMFLVATKDVTEPYLFSKENAIFLDKKSHLLIEPSELDERRTPWAVKLSE